MANEALARAYIEQTDWSSLSGKTLQAIREGLPGGLTSGGPHADYLARMLDAGLDIGEYKENGRPFTMAMRCLLNATRMSDSLFWIARGHIDPVDKKAAGFLSLLSASCRRFKHFHGELASIAREAIKAGADTQRPTLAMLAYDTQIFDHPALSDPEPSDMMTIVGQVRCFGDFELCHAFGQAAIDPLERAEVALACARKLHDIGTAWQHDAGQSNEMKKGLEQLWQMLHELDMADRPKNPKMEIVLDDIVQRVAFDLGPILPQSRFPTLSCILALPLFDDIKIPRTTPLDFAVSRTLRTLNTEDSQCWLEAVLRNDTDGKKAEQLLSVFSQQTICDPSLLIENSSLHNGLKIMRWMEGRAGLAGENQQMEIDRKLFGRCRRAPWEIGPLWQQLSRCGYRPGGEAWRLLIERLNPTDNDFSATGYRYECKDTILALAGLLREAGITPQARHISQLAEPVCVQADADKGAYQAGGAWGPVQIADTKYEVLDIALAAVAASDSDREARLVGFLESVATVAMRQWRSGEDIQIPMDMAKRLMEAGAEPDFVAWGTEEDMPLRALAAEQELRQLEAKVAQAPGLSDGPRACELAQGGASVREQCDHDQPQHASEPQDPPRMVVSLENSHAG